MKTRIILTLALSTMIFLGCNRDSLDDPIDEIRQVEMNQANFDSKAVTNTQAFHIKGIGDFEVVKPIECRSNGQINLEGRSKEANLGQFRTIWKNCTDFRESNLIKGMHIQKGDELHFYSDRSGKDMNGNYYVIIYTGGTGKFAKAKGMMKLYHRETWITTDKGTYYNEGKGTLRY
ncbi:MAG: hypothetical protein HKN54_07795 [Flavobacteriaceae bacterium]|nr:hypothetical protein [Flavobacteriaceae bacterium]